MDEISERHVALVGLSGVGKSTLAPIVAARLGIGNHVDLDREIEKQVGISIAEMFADGDEAKFRRIESEALAEVIEGPPVVVATGGGIVLDRQNRALLRAHASVVWLKARPEHLAQRLSDTAEARPLLIGDPEFALRRLADEREALYHEVANVVVDVDGRDVESIVVEVVDALR